MAKNKRHPWLKGIVGSWVGWQTVKYVSQHPHFLRDLKHSVKNYAQAISDFGDALQSLRLNTAQMKVELKKSEKTFNEIQQSVDRFQYKLEPRRAKINELQKHLSNELNQAQKEVVAKKRK
ncbi:chromosome segregation protein SMC [Pediococcus acidilactici]|uniref:chromosome segregation protein SMC n=1 Tax=Pediococcus acidilactici TaxID=1254 RepID=UPI001324ECBF|nr:chromosome segregation protein SMC [Pediococcus acidilactici]KAF0335356.1 chromosome segregation protein SMC [Pediococcus acidilactici]KAF0347145.1 chromosome segregation protein SMC [Pediococcus acidilactici]KAF0394827.1 chromosome segregation protein SMC [Pediococcus acidilactici]KAF0398513.1 chromosome segregation protein SMC [Pediococcus acidilactici]KAF0411663.1 chromosome segregation protein SMC [Pediococcus acidilactici]